jgi:hypothetical protein
MSVSNISNLAYYFNGVDYILLSISYSVNVYVDIDFNGDTATFNHSASTDIIESISLSGSPFLNNIGSIEVMYNGIVVIPSLN